MHLTIGSAGPAAAQKLAQRALNTRKGVLGALSIDFDNVPPELEVHSVLTSYSSLRRPVYRVNIGAPILAKERKTFPLDPFVQCDCLNDLSGAIGFMDIVFGMPARNSNGKPSAPAAFNSPLTILVIGVEPDFQRQGFGALLLKLAEQIAISKQICLIHGADVQNVHMQEAMLRRGYQRSRRFPQQMFKCIGLHAAARPAPPS